MKVTKAMPFFGLVMGLILAIATSGFTGDLNSEKDASTYYFVFHPERGPASNPQNWEYTLDGTGCTNDGMSCKILLPEDYVNTSTSPVTIDETAFPGNQLPTIDGLAGNKVPDPDRTDIYLSIANQNP